MNKYIMFFLLLPSLARAAAAGGRQEDLQTARDRFRNSGEPMVNEDEHIVAYRFLEVLPGGTQRYVWFFLPKDQKPQDIQ